MRFILAVALSHIMGWAPSEATTPDKARGAAVPRPRPVHAEAPTRKSPPKQPAVKPTPEPAWKAIERRCDAKEIQACFDLAQMYWDGRVTGWWEGTKAMTEFRNALAISQAQARASQEDACASGNGSSCFNLGLMHETGEGAGKDKAKAAALYQRACDAGNALACDQLGFMHERGEGVVRDRAKAAALRQKACDAGSANGCNNLGRMHYNGTGVAQDKAQAAALYQKACDAGSARGCNNLGWMLEHGESVASDQAISLQLYQKACDAGNADGCNNLGRMRYNGTGVAQDKAQAAALYQKACDAGNAWGCKNLGWMLEHGESVAPDQAMALQLYQKACDAGNADGCNDLGRMYYNGTGVAQDKAQAAALYRKACDAGSAWGCKNLGGASSSPAPATPAVRNTSFRAEESRLFNGPRQNQSPPATSGESAPASSPPVAPEDPASAGRGWIWVGAVVSLVGIATAFVGLERGVQSPKSDSQSARVLFMVGAAGGGLAFSGVAMGVVGFQLRQNAYLQASYEPSRTMVLPWTFTLLGGAVAAGGVAMAAVGASSRSTKMAEGGGLLAFGGCLVAEVFGELLAFTIHYESSHYALPKPNLRLRLSLRPWIAPIVTSSSPDARSGSGFAAGLQGIF